jgi:phenolic acid decarboxylase
MKCPFCNMRLQVWQHAFETIYACVENNCIVDDMPRYQIAYNNYPTYLLFKTFMLNNFYVQINYSDNETVISRLKACFLFDTIKLRRALSVDFNNLQDLIDKINTLLIFS